ncbi:Phospholipase A1 [Methylophilaceae bacterium]|nr:Phospholipase A1 [Methylophilaceae bacterium]
MNIRASVRAAFFAAMIFPLYGLAAEDWLVISKGTIVNAGQELKIDIVKPATATWPDTLKLKLSGAGISEEITLTAGKMVAGSEDGRRTYTATPMRKYAGIVRASLMEVESNQFLLLASTDDDSGPVSIATESGAAPSSRAASSPKVVIAQPGEEPALAAHEPTYFVVGNSSDRGGDARFQLSFKYRLFDPDGPIARFSPLFSNLYFTYTQTSLWDLGEDSSPFRDTSYRPGMMYRWAGSGSYWLPDEWRAGMEHESNGQSGTDTRSINTAYLRPAWHIDMPDGKRLSFMPKVYHYLDKDENRDIQRYRGYVDWMARYGREDGLILNGLYRQGTGGYATGQIDLSYPISEKIFARTGSFVHLQLFSGYGETLLEYDRDRDTQIRLGISIAR